MNNNNIYLTDEEKMIIVHLMCCAIGEGYRGISENKLIVIANKLGFTKEEIDL